MKMDRWLRNMFISVIFTLIVGILIKLSGGPIVSSELGITIFFGMWITMNQMDLMNNNERKNKTEKASKNRKAP